MSQDTLVKTEVDPLRRHGPSETVAFEIESVGLGRLAETLAAFANAHGGVVLVGVDPDGRSVRGVRAPDAVVDKALAAGLRCEPPLFLPMPVKAVLDDREVLVVEVPNGLPHAYAHRGTYLIRSGKRNVPLGPRQLRQLLRERGEADFQGQPAAGTTLDELDGGHVRQYAAAFLGESVPDLARASAPSKQAILDLLSRRGCLVKVNGTWQPTNAGFLLFGREPQRLFPSAEILLARYSGKAMSDQFLRETIRGALPDQVQRAEAFVAANMRKGARIDGLQRADRSEYPLAAVREAIVNAVAHRDYAIRGDEIRVLMFADRIEVYSPGRLPGHVTLDNLVEERYSRNAVIAQVLADLGFIERLGYGIDRMIRLMREWGLPAPRFAEMANGFRVTLRGPGDKWIDESSGLDRWRHLDLGERQQRALEYLVKNERITHRDCRELFPDVSEETIRRDLVDLVEKGLLLKMGDKKGTHYILK